MAYEVLARKYRPQQFSDVVGQEHVTGTLANAIRTERVAHAYLFVGPRGTGKTTTARILAKTLNCEKGPTVDPCDACDACREIMAGNSLDVMEIDGASNNSVDQVRDLRQNVQYAPARGPYKIYIIDEVHMLSTSAFNALLKTLEEPPSHVKFVFATTEPQKVPSTILSRCQRFDLRRISVRGIIDRLRDIVTKEGLEVDEDALLAVARGAEGGMRDAQSALDQLISFREGRVSEADVLAVFGLVSWAVLESLAGAVLTGDVATAMQQVADLDREGKDLQRVVIELLEHFRNLLISRYRKGGAEADELTEAQWQAVSTQANLVEPDQLLHIVDLLTETEAGMKNSLSRRTLLETCLIRASRAASTVGVDALIKQVDAIRQDIHSHSSGPKNSPGRAIATETPASGSPPGRANRPGEPLPTGSARRETETPDRGPAQSEDIGELSRGASPYPVDAVEPQAVEEPIGLPAWDEVVVEIGKSAPLTRSVLKTSYPVSIDPDSVTIAIDELLGEQAQLLEQPRQMKAVQRVLSRRLGHPVDVRFERRALAERKPGVAVDMPVAPEPEPEPKEAPPPAPAPAPGPAAAPATKQQSDWYDNETVQAAMNVFQGDVTDVKQIGAE